MARGNGTARLLRERFIILKPVHTYEGSEIIKSEYAPVLDGHVFRGRVVPKAEVTRLIPGFGLSNVDQMDTTDIIALETRTDVDGIKVLTDAGSQYFIKNVTAGHPEYGSVWQARGDTTHVVRFGIMRLMVRRVIDLEI